MSNKTKIIGISGCTNGGKTTLSKRLLASLPNCTYLSQDDFYHPRDNKHLEYLPELDSFNFDVISAINMEKFHERLRQLIESDYDFIILDGFLLFEDSSLYNMLDVKYFLYLNKDECLRRRQNRNYKSIDTPNYFEKCVWVEFMKYKQKCELIFTDIAYIDGSWSIDEIFFRVLNDLNNLSN